MKKVLCFITCMDRIDSSYETKSMKPSHMRSTVELLKYIIFIRYFFSLDPSPHETI